MKIDPNRSVAWLDARIDAEPNPRHKAMLTNYKQHLFSEVTGNLPAIMQTLVPEPKYHFYNPASNGEGPKTRKDVEQFYVNMFESKMNVLERGFKRVIVTDDFIVSEGHMDHVYPGRLLAARGEPADADAWYLATYSICAILPYVGQGTDVLMYGEDTYTGGFPAFSSLKKLRDDELPDLLK